MSRFWSQEEESLLEECFTQITENPNTSADQQMNTFWDKVIDIYNKEANKRNYRIRTKNMLRGKWLLPLPEKHVTGQIIQTKTS